VTARKASRRNKIKKRRERQEFPTVSPFLPLRKKE
jgi:hypothetical protein